MSLNQHLVLIGINHNTAPIEVRERLAIPAGRLADATRTLLHQPGIREGLILSTCNRVELVTLQEDSPATEGNKADLLPFLPDSFPPPPHTIHPHPHQALHHHPYPLPSP